MADNPPMSDQDSPTDSVPQRNALWAMRCDARHRAMVSYRYHRKRQRFFDLLDKVTKSLTVLLGASLLGMEVRNLLPLVASAISGIGLLALVFGYGDRKQSHKELAEQFMALVEKIEGRPFDSVTTEVATQWQAEMARLNAKEPPSLKTLVILCEHEQASADGHPGHVPMPGWHKRALSDFCA